MAGPVEFSRILVVDDEPFFAEALRRVLGGLGHYVEVAGGPASALAVFEPGRFDLVITDYDMPEMKGDQLAALLRAMSPRQRILMVSGQAEEIRPRISPGVVEAVLAKPFNITELAESVRAALDGPAQVDWGAGGAEVAAGADRI